MSWNLYPAVKLCLISRQPPCEAVSWNGHVNLRRISGISQPPCEAVSWNQDCQYHTFHKSSQPPCEAVSWNFTSYRLKKCRPASASLWGCELKYLILALLLFKHRQPPCEAVSWNNFLSSLYDVKICQPPCEAVSWNLQSNYNYMEHYMSASLWGCELKCDRVIFDGIQRRSASLWGCELK